jgi:methionyl aminopeptidase
VIRLKNDKQISGIRASCRLLRRMYDQVLPQVKPGMTTRDVDDMCLKFMQAHGGKPAWYRENFPGAICISINEQVIHGVPSRRRILEGDLVSIDSGIDLGGFISDAAVTLAMGKVSKAAEALVDVTHRCLWAGIEACKAGNRISDITHAVYDLAHGEGYGLVWDFSGHGVGLEVHE